MGRKNRKFIDKKYDTIHSFRVVQRSQKDPLVADENAPQGVLIDTECSDSHKEELQKYGVYFDDDYNYLQHLRGVQEAVDWEDCDLEVYTIRHEDPKIGKSKKGGLVLPSSVFESYVEEPIGLLNKAAPVTGPRPELDPDIVAELDSDDEDADVYDPEDENGLPDNFVSLLNAEDDDNYKEEEYDASYSGIEKWLGGTAVYYDNDMPPLEESFEDENSIFSDDSKDENIKDYCSDEEKDEVGSLPNNFSKKGAKTSSTSRTSGSAASLPRTELQKTFDEKFEIFYRREYSDDQIGALDGEVIEGPFSMDSPVVLQAMATTRKQFQKLTFSSLESEDKDRTIDWVKNNMKLRNDMIGEKEELVEIEVPGKPMFDVESYHEYRASLTRGRNLPHVIDHRPRNKKSDLTKKAIREHNKMNDDDESSSESESEDGKLTLKSQISLFSHRPKDEAPDDRRDRKNKLKELRRARREEKKLNKLCFKEIKKSENQNKRNPGRIVSLSGLL